MGIFFKTTGFFLACSFAFSTARPPYAALQENSKFQRASKTINNQIIAVNEAAGQEIMTPPEDQKGILRLGISTSPSATPSSSVTPSPSVSPSASVTPSASITVSASASVSTSAAPSRSTSPRSTTPSPPPVSAVLPGPSRASSPAPSISPMVSDISVSLSPVPSQSGAPLSIECPYIHWDHGRDIQIGDVIPRELIPNTASVPHFGDEDGICAYYVKIPENAKTYTATLSSEGPMALIVAFTDYPHTYNSDGVNAVCYSESSRHSSGWEKCEGDLRGAENIYLKITGYAEFNNAVLEVTFDEIPPSPSPTAGAISCPQASTYLNGTSLISSELVQLPVATAVGGHFGVRDSECSYYVNVPPNSVNYEATANGVGDFSLFVGFDGPPSFYVNDCGIYNFANEPCTGLLPLNGREKLFVKIIGYAEFSDTTIAVNFDSPTMTA